MKVAVWLFVACASALQLLSVPDSIGNHEYTEGLGVDFTVYEAIDVSAIGLIDTDERGITSTSTARILDRTDGRVVVGPSRLLSL